MRESCTSSKNPYAQIALTYLRRKMFWLSGGILLIMLIGLTFHAFYQEGQQESQRLYLRGITDPASRELIRAYWADHAADYAKERADSDVSNIEMVLLGEAWILVTILSHLTEQIASPRAVLIPNYRRPHLLVAAAFALPLLILIPLCISASFAMPPLAVLATTILFSALVLWALSGHNRPLGLIFMVVWFGSCFPPGRHLLHFALANTAVWQSLLLIAFGLAAIAGLAPWLLRLREEMPGYSRQVVINMWPAMTKSGSAQSAAQIDYQKPLNRLLYGTAQRQLAHLAVSKPASLQARLHRWQLGGNPASLTWALVLMLFAPILFCAYMEGSAGFQLVLPVLVFCPMLPFPICAGATWSTLGLESLRPITRAAFLCQRAAALAFQVAQVWLILAAALVAYTSLVNPAALSDPIFWITLAVTAFLQVPLFAISIWVVRICSPLVLVALPPLGYGIGISALLECEELHFSLPIPWLAAITLALLLVSAFILRDAYRRWFRTDLA